MLAASEKIDSFSRAFVLKEIGCCHQEMGQLKTAYDKYEASLLLYEALDPHPSIQFQIGLILEKQANVSLILGDITNAKALYTRAKSIADAMENNIQRTSLSIGMGMAVRAERNFAEAARFFRAAIHSSHLLNDSVEEAVGWDELGVTYQMAQKWEQAEFAYRQSAAIKESKGIIYEPRGIISTWHNLALVLQNVGKLQEAEAWYQKVIDADCLSGGNSVNSASYFANFANCLRLQGKSRLSEAHHFAQQALLIGEKVDPDSVRVWDLYGILASISTQQGEAAKAQDYRRLSRQSYAAFAGSRHALQRWEDLIQAVVVAVGDAEVRQQLEEDLSDLPALAMAVQRIWSGVWDEDELCDELDYRAGAIVLEILRRLGSP
jgi:hypothetical protein